METQKNRSSNRLSRVCRQGDTVRSVSKKEIQKRIMYIYLYICYRMCLITYCYMNSQIAIRGKRHEGSTSYPMHIDMHRQHGDGGLLGMELACHKSRTTMQMTTFTTVSRQVTGCRFLGPSQHCGGC